MKRYYDFEAISEGLKAAIQAELCRHGIHNLFHPLAVCGLLEAAGSPLKMMLTGSALSAEIGEAGLKLLELTRILARVETIKNPQSLVVNPMMEAIVTALHLSDPQSVTDTDLFRLSILQFERDGGRRGGEAASANHSLMPAFQSALGYLVEAGIIEKDESALVWQIRT